VSAPSKDPVIQRWRELRRLVRNLGRAALEAHALAEAKDDVALVVRLESISRLISRRVADLVTPPHSAAPGVATAEDRISPLNP
jgi:hypothetical protein